MQSGDLPHAPEDCKRFDEACTSLYAAADDLFMYFDPQAESRWSPATRWDLLQGAVKRYNEAREAVAYEERRLH